MSVSIKAFRPFLAGLFFFFGIAAAPGFAQCVSANVSVSSNHVHLGQTVTISGSARFFGVLGAETPGTATFSFVATFPNGTSVNLGSFNVSAGSEAFSGSVSYSQFPLGTSTIELIGGGPGAGGCPMNPQAVTVTR
ncbi:MAG TPA: hypothetical protein VKZ53_01235 [Candidatus Angelobacter sp.]|nr:hypothetical protein [Candidatus Angelobacter sp.]